MPDICHDCLEWGEDEPATHIWDRGVDYAFWKQEPRFIQVCERHWDERDNQEGPEVSD